MPGTTLAAAGAVASGSIRPMASDSDKRLERRVIEAAEVALAARGFATAIDVLAGLGWLPPSS